jgi:hypothetical protein
MSDQVQSDLAVNDASATTSGRGAQRKQQRGTINANHLLNFQSGARDTRNTSDSTATNRRRPLQQRSSRSSRPAAYDRTKFLQANFRFIISDASEIQKYEADPDLMLNWDDIAAVDVITTSVIQCPITLGPPLCPCITPCGHIFSEEAIMAHMISQGGPELRVSSAACPVCTTQVSSRELRPVLLRYVGGNVIGTGDLIRLRLLKRGKDSIIPQPVGSGEGGDSKLEIDNSSSEDGGGGGGGGSNASYGATSPPAAAWRGGNAPASTLSNSLHSNKCNNKGEEVLPCNLYAKFTAASDPMPLWCSRVRILSKKSVQLLAEGGLDATYEVPPIVAAIEAMANRARAWTERRERLLIEKLNDEEVAAALAGGALAAAELAGKEAMAALKRVAEVASVEEEKVHKKTAAVHALEEAFPALSVGLGEKKATALATTEGTMVEKTISNKDSVNANSNAPPPSFSTPQLSTSTLAPPFSEIYFYQSVDGQLIFLCPLNMKMLLESTGYSYTSLPHEIIASVLELEEIEQTESSRKRLSFCCGHLPLGGLFKLCEVDLSNILPPEALLPFEAELTQREKKRVQIAKLEARKNHREAAKAKTMAAAKAAAAEGPSLAELAAMPLPGASSDPVPVPKRPSEGLPVVEGEEEEGAAGASPSSTSSFPGGSSAGGGGAGGGSQAGISFARIAKMGFAATGPALGEGVGSPSSPPWDGNAVTANSGGAWPGSQSPIAASSTSGGGGGGAWGNTNSNASGLSAQIDAALASSSGGGKKKGKKIMLLSTSHRR